MSIATYHREITPGAADAYLRQMTKDGTLVDLSSITGVEFMFENVETVTLRPEAIKRLWVAGERADNFYVRFPASETSVLDARTDQQPKLAEPGIERMKQHQNITTITLHRGEHAQALPVAWSALSWTDAENLGQHFALVDGDLIICARLPQSYAMVDVVAAAARPENRIEIIGWLEKHIDSLRDHAPKFVDDVLEELQSFAGLAEYQPQWLVVRYDEANADDPWDPVYRVAGDDTDYGGIEWLSYAELMGMRLTIEGPSFFAGFAALLWELTFEGLEANDREVGIARMQAELKAGDEEYAAFNAATAKMQRFLTYYATAHKADADVDAVIAKYQPLTAGVTVRLDEDDPDSMEGQLTKQDEQLLAEFMQQFGAEYQAFE